MGLLLDSYAEKGGMTAIVAKKILLNSDKK